MLFLICAVASAAAVGRRPDAAEYRVRPEWVRAHEEFLASDALQGRGSGTRDELIAATYIGSQMRAFGIEPGGDDGGYVQRVRIPGPEERYTYNAVGKLTGGDAARRGEVVLLTAHLDHLGVRPDRPGDNIYNGADDDASGCTAVLELARALGALPRPKRTVYFVCFGSEEAGGFGARYFVDHPPVPLDSIVANLEFEMIGRPDPAVAPHTLWLTGYERTDLGPDLAKHGARLVADPHPEQRFFQRSDNITLARRGVVAQTVSSFGLHPQYHHPDDDLAHLVIAHMADAIGSMVAPVAWLVNADYRPQWLPGKKP
jgi:Zn-dependent M28 family amino/carboxypeptidase